MRYFTRFGLGLAAALLSISAASAAPNFYVGGDYQFLSASFKSPYDGVLPKTLSNGIDAHVGMGFMNNYAVELGYMGSSGDRNLNVAGKPVSTTTNIQGPTLDFLGYIPLARNLYGIGTVGVSDLKGEATIETGGSSVKASKSEFGYRGGVGIELRIQQQFGIRAIVRYQSADFDNIANHAIIGSLGFNFYF